MWGCSLWQIKGRHLWSVSFPQTKWEVRQVDLQHAYQGAREREMNERVKENVLTDPDRGDEEVRVKVQQLQIQLKIYSLQV